MQHANSSDDDVLDVASRVTAGGVDVRGYVFVIPVDAPIPSEVSGAVMPTGSLYARLAPLANEVDKGGFAFVPLSGAELLALERAWRSLQTVKHVGVLMELPGARYDVLFTQAARQIGLMKFEWTQVADGLTAQLVELQRLRDTQPWATAPSVSPEKNGKPRAKAPGYTRSYGEPVPEPAADEDDA